MKEQIELIRKKFNSLTSRQKLVARYFIDNFQQAAFHTAKEVGKLTGTSEATVIRFCHTLNYSGYSQFQKEIQRSIAKAKEPDLLVEFRESTTALSKEENLAEHIMRQDIHYIEKTLSTLNEQQYQKIIETLLQAKKIIVVGFRSSYASANWFAFSLNLIRGDTYLHRGEIDDAIHTISELDQQSVVFALSFPRYAQETAVFVKAAKNKGAAIIAITDDGLSPVGLLADLVWKVETPSPTAIKGMAPIFSVLNVLVTGVASAGGKAVQERLENYEQTSRQFSPFVNKEEK